MTPQEEKIKDLETLVKILDEQNKRFRFALEVLSTSEMGIVEYAKIYESQVKQIAYEALWEK